MFRKNRSCSTHTGKFLTLASIAMLGMVTGCNVGAAPIFAVTFLDSFLLLPIRSITGTALLSFINSN